MRLITFSSSQYRPMADRMIDSAVRLGGFKKFTMYGERDFPNCDGQGDPRLLGYLWKMNSVLQGIRDAQNCGEPMVCWCDSDCYFFRNCVHDLKARVLGLDAAFSNNGSGRISTGIYVMRTNDKMLDFWTRVSNQPGRWIPGVYTGFDEWGAWDIESSIRFSLLPDIYWNCCYQTPMPEDASMVHLSCILPGDKERVLSEIISKHV